MSTGARYPRWTPGMELRDDWFALVQEDIIDPDRPVIDPHHHLWVHGIDGEATYETDELARDTGSGHNVVQTVYIECRSYYDQSAPAHLQSVGETATVARMAERAKGKSRITGIIANLDLRRDDLDDLIAAHKSAGQGLLRGIRHSGACDPDPDSLMIPGRAPAGLYLDRDFQRGVAALARHGLTYDTWHYHHQAEDFLTLARAVPDTILILDHLSTPLGVGRFKGKRDEVFEPWQEHMEALSKCPNVFAKLGGMCMPDNGWGWEDHTRPPGSDDLVAAQGKWYDHMLNCFGPERCMFESNFPVDRISVSYPILWNAFKKIAAPLDEAAKNRLFHGTAQQVYGLPAISSC